MSEEKPQRVSFGLVRDANGIPKFDDPSNVPAEIIAMLTDDDIGKLDDRCCDQLGVQHRKAAHNKHAERLAAAEAKTKG